MQSLLLILESCVHQPEVDRYVLEGPYSHRGEKYAGTVEHSFGRLHMSRLLREIQVTDSRIQH